MDILNNFKPENIIAVDVYLEKHKARTYVGRLEQHNDTFCFIYDKNYLEATNALPLGPDLLLTKRVHESTTLFASLQDRIPMRENPAYKDYCKSTGISENETNPIILLATIGKRGPSAFVFEPVYKESFSAQDLQMYRKSLELTIREFAAVFDVSAASIYKIENNKLKGSKILRKIAIMQKFPEVALYEVIRNGGVLPHQKKQKIIDKLKVYRKALD